MRKSSFSGILEKELFIFTGDVGEECWRNVSERWGRPAEDDGGH
jgi:hypothetical protein